MSLLKKIKDTFKSLNKRTSRETANYFADVNPFGVNEPVLEVQEMLSLTYITRSIQMIANDVAKVNFLHYKWNPSSKTREIVWDSVYNWLLNRSPSDNLKAYDFKKVIVWNLFLFSYAPIFIHKTIDKKTKEETIIELIPLYPNSVARNIDELNGKITYEVQLNEGQEPVLLNESDVIWLEYEIINNVENSSLKALFKSTFDKLKENERALYNSIKNDVGVSMLITLPDITDEEAVTNARESINSMTQMQKKMGSIAMVKDARWTVEPNTNVIASKIDYATRNAIAREVAAVFGIPASRLGIEDNNKYNTMVERNRAYSEEAVRPIINRITTSLTDKFFKKQYDEEIDIRAIDLLNMDPGALKDFASSAITNGYATPNEIRQLIGFDSIVGGDRLMINSATLPIDLLIQKLQKEIDVLGKEPPANPNGFKS